MCFWYDFKYEYNNEICRYVPDFYFETANEKILIEVKSWFTLGFKRFENDYFNEDALLKALAKAESANNICIDNNFLSYDYKSKSNVIKSASTKELSKILNIIDNKTNIISVFAICPSPNFLIP